MSESSRTVNETTSQLKEKKKKKKRERRESFSHLGPVSVVN